MKKILYFVFGLLLVGVANAQSLDYAWHGAAKGVFYREIYHEGGDIYLRGEFGGAPGTFTDIDPTSGVDQYQFNQSFGSRTFITKMDSLGNYLFSLVPIGDYVQYYGFALATDGTIVISGTADSAGVDFDPGPALVGFYGNYPHASFLLFLDAGGNYLGHIEYGFQQYGLNNVAIYDVETDDNNNLYFGGVLYGHADMDFTSSVDSFAAFDGNGVSYVSKINLTNSSYAWTNIIHANVGMSTYAEAYELFAENNEVMAYGKSVGDSLFVRHGNTVSIVQSGSQNPFTENLMMVKLDPQGNFLQGGFLWTAKNYPPNVDFEMDSEGNFVLLTNINRLEDSMQVAFSGPEVWVPLQSQYDYIVSSYDSQMNLLWYRSFYSNSDQSQYAVDINHGLVAIVGGFIDSLFTYDGTTTSLVMQSVEYMSDAVVMDNYGHIVAGHLSELVSAAGSSYPYAESQCVALSPSGNLYVTGDLEGEIDFDPSGNVASSNSTDTANYHYADYIFRLDLNGFVHAGDPGQITEVQLFPNPAHDRIVLNSDLQMRGAVVRDLQGRALQSLNFDPTLQFQIDVNALSAGMYIVELHGDFGQVSMRFAKQ